MDKELELRQQRAMVRVKRNHYYCIATSINVGTQLRQVALQKIEEMEQLMEQLQKQIEEERNKKWTITQQVLKMKKL